MVRIRDPKNLACAILFIALAAVLAYNALLLPIGSASEMGPGYFPLTLAVVLAGLGGVLAVQSLQVQGARAERIEWRAASLITLSLVAFGLTIVRLGFIPAVVLTVVIALLAHPPLRALRAVVLTVVLLAFCWAVFVAGLGLPVRLFGS